MNENMEKIKLPVDTSTIKHQQKQGFQFVRNDFCIFFFLFIPVDNFNFCFTFCQKLFSFFSLLLFLIYI